MRKFSRDDRDRIRHYVGYKKNAAGKRVQQPFYLGTEDSAAEIRLGRLNELWGHVVELCKVRPPRISQILQEIDPRKLPPVWSDESLWIALELAKGQVQVEVSRKRPDGRLMNEPDYAERIRLLSATYPMVYFVPEDITAYEVGKPAADKSLSFRLQTAYRSLIPIQPTEVTNVTSTKSKSLHDALDLFIKQIQKDSVEPTDEGSVLTAHGVIRIECIGRIKQRSKDIPLSSLDFDHSQELYDIWRNRPTSTVNGETKVLSKRYCTNHIKEMKRFFRWLSRNRQLGWVKPIEFDDLQTNVRDTTKERTKVAQPLKLHSIEDLTLLYANGSNLQRLLLLLALNCSFRGAEAGTLEESHIYLESGHPHEKYLKQICKFEPKADDRFIIYGRHKSSIRGEYILWHETIKAIHWGLKRKADICEKLTMKSDRLLLTIEGQAFYRRTKGNKNVSQIFANKWDKLNKKVKEKHLDFTPLPYGRLRKTATDLVRHHSDGEVASVFEMHGKVTSDDLLDLYSNRPFNKVFLALREVRKTLAPMFEACPDAFSDQVDVDE